MKNLFKNTLALLTLTAILSGCGNGVTTSATIGASNFVTSANGNPNALASGQPGQKGHGKGDMKGGPGQFGGEFEGITLTDEQKTQLDALRPQPSSTDEATRKANMEAVQKAIKDAFLSDSIDANSLKATLAQYAPTAPDTATQAANMIKAYNILTAEQKATLETNIANRAAKQSEMDANRPSPSPDANKTNPMIDKFATDLALTDAQKTSLAEIFAPPSESDRAAKDSEMKANQDAIHAAVVAGDATKLATLLSAQKRPDNTDDQIAKLVKLHDLLTADQRTKIADKIPFFGGHGGPGGERMGHGAPEGQHGRPDGLPPQMPSATV